MKLQFLAEFRVFNVNCYLPEKYEDERILDWECNVFAYTTYTLIEPSQWDNQEASI